MSPSLQVSLLNYVFLVSWAFALPYSHYRPLASSVCTVWTCIIIICKMLYQLKSINPLSYSKNCSAVNISLQELVEPAHWVGLRKSNDLLDYLRVSGDHQMPSFLFKYKYSC